MTRRAFRVRYNRNDPGGQWQAMMLQAQEGVWGEVPRMRSRIALALAGAALVASAALPVGAAADTPQYAGTFTGWKCLVQAPVLNCDLQISGGDAWDDFPLGAGDHQTTGLTDCRGSAPVWWDFQTLAPRMV